MTLQQEQWIRLIKDRLDKIAETSAKTEVEAKVDSIFIEIEHLETMLKES